MKKLSKAQDSQNIRGLTFGEKAVGLTFNPGGSEEVNEIKELYAKIIDKLNDKKFGADMLSEETVRMIDVAITEAQTAQMWAVKAVTFRY